MASREATLAGLLALVLVAGLGLMWWLFWPQRQGDFVLAEATVLATSECGSPDAKDTVRVAMPASRAVEAKLDGCGNHPGDQLTVEVPQPLPAQTPVVSLAGTGLPTAATNAQRVSTLLMAASGMAGAALAWRLRPVQH